MSEKRMYRSRTERKIAGVCGGIAENAGVDPVFIRLGAVALALVFPPAGLIGYLACWAIVPEGSAQGGAARVSYEPPQAQAESAGAGPAQEPSSGQAAGAGDTAGSAWSRMDGSLIGGMIFVAIGLFFLMMNLGLFDWGIFRFWRWRMVWPMVVIVLGILMLVRGMKGRNEWGTR